MAMATADFKSARVNFGYDSVGRLDSVFLVANEDYSTPVTTSYTLDLLDRVTDITHSKTSGSGAVALSEFSYTYDANGRVIGSTGPEGSLSFALDANGQLLSVTGSRSEAYAFDANGNRTTNTTGTGNLLLSDGQFSYTYDLEGNRKTRTRLSDGQVTETFWDHRNQLTKALVKDANGVLLKELRFTYDVEGRRVGVWVDADGAGPGNPNQVWTVFDGANPYMDFDGAGDLQTRYLYGPGVDELFARIGAGEDPQWYLTDRLGSVRQIVDGSGTILDEIIYDSFGNVLSESNPSQGDRFKFTGREFSPDLGIYYYRARWYDPSTGQFISQDPIGFTAGDTNLYRYVGNGPWDGTDPSGLFFEKKENTPTGIGNAIRFGEGEKDIPKNQIGGPNDLPTSLRGKWEISICSGGGHAWIRFENIETGKVHTTGRYQNGYGGRMDEGGTIRIQPVIVSGVQWDRDIIKEEGVKTKKFAIRSIVVCDPKIFKGASQFGYNSWGNNCATYARDAWYFYSREYFYMPGPDLPGTVEKWIRDQNEESIFHNDSMFWSERRNSILNRMP